MVKVPPSAVPQLAPCASSARTWRLWAARHSQSEAQPLGTQPPPRGLKRTASKVADSTAFDRAGAGRFGILTMCMDKADTVALAQVFTKLQAAQGRGSTLKVRLVLLLAPK